MHRARTPCKCCKPSCTVHGPHVSAASPSCTVHRPHVSAASPSCTVHGPHVSAASPSCTVHGPHVSAANPSCTVHGPSVTLARPSFTEHGPIKAPFLPPKSRHDHPAHHAKENSYDSKWNSACKKAGPQARQWKSPAMRWALVLSLRDSAMVAGGQRGTSAATGSTSPIQIRPGRGERAGRSGTILAHPPGRIPFDAQTRWLRPDDSGLTTG